MSTRSSIAYNDNYHVYSECFEEDQGIYLEMNGNDICFELYPGNLTVFIPKHIIKAILDNKNEIEERLKTCK